MLNVRPKRAEDIRLDHESGRLIQLIREVEPYNVMTGRWLVQEIATGKTYELHYSYMGREIYNEMEAIAWAAQGEK